VRHPQEGTRQYDRLIPKNTNFEFKYSKFIEDDPKNGQILFAGDEIGLHHHFHMNQTSGYKSAF
jgi:hypothetical protein